MILTWNEPYEPDFDPYDKDKNVKVIVGYLMAKAQSMIEYEGLPETIPSRNLKVLLQSHGYCCIPDPKLLDGKLYALWGDLGGAPDPYYMPTLCIVANPALNFSKSLVIDKECVIIPHDSIYMGLIPLVTKYARLLVENELSIYRSTVNIRSMNIIHAETDAEAKSAESYLDKIEAGRLGVIASKGWSENGITVTPNSQTNQSIIQLIELEQYLKASLYNELGLDANFNMKRETLHTSELEINQDALRPFVDDIVETQQKAFDKVNKKWGYNIRVKLSSVWAKDDSKIQCEQNESNQLDLSEGGDPNKT